MAKVTIGYALALIILGLVGFFGTDGTHYTALIPTGFGLVFLVLGIVALNEKAKKHALHAASALALLGILGTLGGLVKALKMIFGTQPERPEAVVAQAVMCIMSVGIFVLYGKSFVDARIRRKAAEAAAAK